MTEQTEHEPWDPQRELDMDMKTERRILWKEIAVISFIIVLVVLKVTYAR